MNNATKAKVLIISAAGLIAPFAVFEAYIVFRYGYAEPYSYMYSIPLGVVSYFIMQFSIGYAVVKGWANCKISRNYLWMAVWVTSALTLLSLPYFFLNKNVL